MKEFFQKTFGGLNASYYFRHLFFGAVISILICLAISKTSELPLLSIIMFTIYALIYPYSRFVYESIVNFIMGDNVFFVNGIMFLVAKLFTMLFCYACAPIIAPIGLIYLYFYHSRKQD